MRPLIAVVGTSPKLRHIMLTPYLESLQRAEAETTLVEWNASDGEIAEKCEACSGLLLTGGNDIHPSLYGEEILPGCGEIDSGRDGMEQRLIRAWLKTGKPLFGICRGLQALNVFFGGTLWQDIPSQRPSEVSHRSSELMMIKERVHSVTFAEGGLLRRLEGRDSLEVNSMHHQGVKDLGKGLTVEALAPDGMVEAFRLDGYGWLLAVQWHPEHLSADDPDHQTLFDAFVRETMK